MTQDRSDEIRLGVLRRRISMAQAVLSGEALLVFRFNPDGTEGHSFIVLAKNNNEAIEKFKHWQASQKAFPPFADEVIENTVDNWNYVKSTTHIII